MKNNLSRGLKLTAILFIFLISNMAFAKFTYEGHLTNLADAPIANQAAVIRVAILPPPSSSCVIFQETHSVTTDNKGFFIVQVGSGGNVFTPTAAPFNNFDGVFLNSPIGILGASACTYNQVAGDGRRMLVEVSTNAGSTYENLGLITLGKSPHAAHADTVGGFDESRLMKVAAGTAPTLSSADLTNFNNLIAGTSSQYVLPGNNGVTAVTALAPLFSSGGTIPQISLVKSTASIDGYLASADFTLFNNKQPSGNYITALSGDLTAAGPGVVVATLANSGVIASSDYTKVTVDAKGRVTSAGSLNAANITSALGFAPVAVGAPIYGTYIKASYTSPTSPTYTFSSDATTGIYSTGTGQLGFATGSSARMVIMPSGNVGIGTTSPTTKLEVIGGLAVGNAITGGNPILNMRLCSGTNGTMLSPVNTTSGASFDIACVGVSVNSAVNCSPNTTLTSTLSWTAQVPTAPADVVRINVTNTASTGSVSAGVNWKCLVAD
ncbi:MAG: hypothetical protein AABY53_01955 [Bdellovibrionota bacterium]